MPQLTWEDRRRIAALRRRLERFRVRLMTVRFTSELSLCPTCGEPLREDWLYEHRKCLGGTRVVP